MLAIVSPGSASASVLVVGEGDEQDAYVLDGLCDDPEVSYAGYCVLASASRSELLQPDGSRVIDTTFALSAP